MRLETYIYLNNYSFDRFYNNNIIISTSRRISLLDYFFKRKNIYYIYSYYII